MTQASSAWWYVKGYNDCLAQVLKEIQPGEVYVGLNLIRHLKKNADVTVPPSDN